MAREAKHFVAVLASTDMHVKTAHLMYSRTCTVAGTAGIGAYCRYTGILALMGSVKPDALHCSKEVHVARPALRC